MRVSGLSVRDGKLSFCEARTKAVTGAMDRQGRRNLRDLPVGPGDLRREEKRRTVRFPTWFLGLCVDRD